MKYCCSGTFRVFIFGITKALHASIFLCQHTLFTQRCSFVDVCLVFVLSIFNVPISSVFSLCYLTFQMSREGKSGRPSSRNDPLKCVAERLVQLCNLESSSSDKRSFVSDTNVNQNILCQNQLSNEKKKVADKTCPCEKVYSYWNKRILSRRSCLPNIQRKREILPTQSIQRFLSMPTS